MKKQKGNYMDCYNRSCIAFNSKQFWNNKL